MKLINFLSQNPTFALSSGSKKINKLLSNLKENFDLNLIQSLILAGLYFENKKSISPKTLSEVLQTTKGAISQSLTILEEYKLIKIDHHPEDKRKQLLSLTSKGEELAIKLIRFFDKDQNEIENFIGSEDLKVFFRVLDKIDQFYNIEK